MGALFGDSLGYSQYNAVIRHWLPLKQWGSSMEIDTIRRLLKFEYNTGSLAVDKFSDYMKTGVRNSLIELEDKAYKKAHNITKVADLDEDAKNLYKTYKNMLEN